MAKVRFNLQTPAQAESYIRLVYRYDNQKLVYYPFKDKIKPSWWNSKTQRLRKNADTPPTVERINTALGKAAASAEDIYWRYRNEGKPLPPDVFRDEMDVVCKNRTKPEETPGIADFVEFFEFWLNERSKMPDYSEGTIKRYRVTLKKLKQFRKETRRSMKFDNIDLAFHGAYVGWLNAKCFSPNYQHKLVQTIKVAMADSFERGLHKNESFRSRRFTVSQETKRHIYLDEKELERMEALDLSKSPMLLKARDLFLIGCATGLRFSDYREVRAENIKTIKGVEVLMVHVTKRKTVGEVSVPVLPLLRRILDRYDGTAPKVMSNQKLNEAIKQVAEMVGIDAPELLKLRRGGVTVEKRVPKYRLVTSHTARRSFATNEYIRAVNEGRSYIPIMKILGQRRELTFLNYVCVTPEQNAIQFAVDRLKKVG